MSAPVEKDAAIRRDLQQQVKRLRRSTIFPNQLRWPPGRKVFAVVITRAIGDGYKVGEILQPLRLYLDAPPDWCMTADVLVGTTGPNSGTTGIQRVA